MHKSFFTNKPCTMLRSLLGSSSSRLVSRSQIHVPHHRRQIHHGVVRLRPQINPKHHHGLVRPAPQIRITNAATISGTSSFHSTPSRQSAPIISFLLAGLKVGASLFVPRNLPILSDNRTGFDRTRSSSNGCSNSTDICTYYRI